MIEVNHLSKKYGEIDALQNVDFVLPRNEIVFFVGPNGAGKSTLMRLMCGYIAPTQGEVLIFGQNIQNNHSLYSSLGYVAENSPLYPDMTVYEYIKYVADLHQIKSRDFVQNLPIVLHNLQLEKVLTQRIDTLSKGFKHRVAIAGALIFNPEILLLDEPTEGLDPNQKYQMHQFIKQYRKNRLIIISSHLMEEVEKIADRVLLMSNGRLRWDGTPQEMMRQSPDGTIETMFRRLTKGQ